MKAEVKRLDLALRLVLLLNHNQIVMTVLLAITAQDQGLVAVVVSILEN